MIASHYHPVKNCLHVWRKLHTPACSLLKCHTVFVQVWDTGLVGTLLQLAPSSCFCSEHVDVYKGMHILCLMKYAPVGLLCRQQSSVGYHLLLTCWLPSFVHYHPLLTWPRLPSFVHYHRSYMFKGHLVWTGDIPRLLNSHCQHSTAIVARHPPLAFWGSLVVHFDSIGQPLGPFSTLQ